MAANSSPRGTKGTGSSLPSASLSTATSSSDDDTQQTASVIPAIMTSLREQIRSADECELGLAFFILFLLFPRCWRCITLEDVLFAPPPSKSVFSFSISLLSESGS
ncbi:hypothetical protein L798_08532 [Zootermopsis nevadensis]|uniref:Uncharacterized protein n=1 Tax=Zootermopsis nevadensis TaxID=136037 RepID=A0A067REU0_ZOONE|nr:hypothetical protein L798_08532 [Zootermopsis nevadensis]